MATLQKKISEAEAEAAKRAVQSKAGAKQLDKLRKDMAKQGESAWCARLYACNKWGKSLAGSDGSSADTCCLKPQGLDTLSFSLHSPRHLTANFFSLSKC